MSDDFKSRIIKGYEIDFFWIKILAIFNKKDSYNDADAVKFFLY